MTTEFGEDIIDIRDVISKYEELESIEDRTEDEEEEFSLLQETLSELEGSGGDEKWRGAWYPVTLIRESYFTEYAIDLLQEIGDLPSEMPWYIVIDEEATAENLKVDYSTIDIDSTTYYYR